MYFMVEYSIYTICRGGLPYYGVVYNSLEECKQALYSIIDYNIKRRKLFYIDNTFYNNKIPYISSDGFYYSIHCREVSEWTKYEDFVFDNSQKNNIINFSEYVLTKK